MTRADMDIVERYSYIKSSANDKDQDAVYGESKSPLQMENGALTEGGALPLLCREAFGLYIQYATIGMLFAVIPFMAYPVFQIYLHLEGYQVTAYTQLVLMAWSFKVFFGMLTDCVAIFGYRRKSWMLIGWFITAICLAVMAGSTMGAPYCDTTKTNMCKRAYRTVPEESRKYFNLDALTQGTKFIVLSMLAGFGYIVSAAASDAMVVEYAQREPLEIRGRLQTAIYTMRSVGSLVGYAAAGMGLNGPSYAGTFSFEYAPNIPYIILLVPTVLAMVSTVYLVGELKAPPTPFRVWWSMFWDLLQKRVMWQICAFRFISNFFDTMDNTASWPVTYIWAHVTPFNVCITDILGSLITSIVLATMAKWGLKWNWRWCIAIGTVGVVVVDSIAAFVTIWNIIRNQWFFQMFQLLDRVPDGVRFIVATYCAVEIAEVGNEGATYGLITTMNNVAAPLASVFYKYIDSFFDLELLLIGKDTTQPDHEIRMSVTQVYIISYCCKLFGLVWLFLLPPQKSQLHELKKKGGKSRAAAITLIVLFIVSLVFGIVTNLMSIYPSTKCYRIAGGKGITREDGTCVSPSS